jgi:uncharacterized protein YggE
MNRKLLLAAAGITTATALAVATVSGVPAHADSPGASPGATISVTGHSEQHVKPDLAVISAGVTTTASDAKTAQQKNDNIVKDLYAALAKAGITGDDVHTTWYSIHPSYGAPTPGGKPAPSGFEAVDNIEVRVHNLDDVGSVIDLLVKSGANQVNGVNFEVSNPLAVQKQAYSAALADARSQAESIAKSLGVQITGVQSVETTPSGAPAPIVYSKAMMDSTAAPVTPGTQTISTDVKVVFTVKSGN